MRSGCGKLQIAKCFLITDPSIKIKQPHITLKFRPPYSLNNQNLYTMYTLRYFIDPTNRHKTHRKYVLYGHNRIVSNASRPPPNHFIQPNSLSMIRAEDIPIHRVDRLDRQRGIQWLWERVAVDYARNAPGDHRRVPAEEE